VLEEVNLTQESAHDLHLVVVELSVGVVGGLFLHKCEVLHGARTVRSSVVFSSPPAWAVCSLERTLL
jgi:hypothetical protein